MRRLKLRAILFIANKANRSLYIMMSFSRTWNFHVYILILRECRIFVQNLNNIESIFLMTEYLETW